MDPGEACDWAHLVALLTVRFNMPTDAAWRCTFREFVRLIAVQRGQRKLNDGKFDHDKHRAFEAHLRNMGIKV